MNGVFAKVYRIPLSRNVRRVFASSVAAERDWKNRRDVHAADALAWAALWHGEAGKAATVIEWALAPGGASPTILLHAAVIRLRTGHADEARALFARALACPAALTPTERRLADRVRSELASVAGPTSK